MVGCKLGLGRTTAKWIIWVTWGVYVEGQEIDQVAVPGTCWQEDENDLANCTKYMLFQVTLWESEWVSWRDSEIGWGPHWQRKHRILHSQINKMYPTHALTQGRGHLSSSQFHRPPRASLAQLHCWGPWRGGGQGLTGEKLLSLTAWWVPALACPLLGTLNMSGAADSTLEGCPSRFLSWFHVSWLYTATSTVGVRVRKPARIIF